MLTVIQIGLALAATYCTVMWLYMLVASFRGRQAIRYDESLRREVQLHTFHLGLCGVVAAGFLGLLVR